MVAGPVVAKAVEWVATTTARTGVGRVNAGRIYQWHDIDLGKSQFYTLRSIDGSKWETGFVDLVDAVREGEAIAARQTDAINRLFDSLKHAGASVDGVGARGRGAECAGAGMDETGVSARGQAAKHVAHDLTDRSQGSSSNRLHEDHASDGVRGAEQVVRKSEQPMSEARHVA